MRVVMWIDSEGQRWWVRQQSRWVAVEVPPPGVPIHIVTDLPDEAFAEISLPRLFGKDRVDYLQRQAALRFPDSRYRALLPPAPDQGWLERLAPRKQVLAAIESGDAIDTALSAVRERPIVGLWSASQVLAYIGSRRGMPPNLFVLVHSHDHLRIVFLRRRVPVLTRRVRVAHDPKACANELVRTLRHLENTHAVERDKQRFGVLVLGDDGAVAQHWGDERLDLVSVLQGACEPHVLDAVMRKPPGQLAPLALRVHHVASQVRSVSWAATACVCAVTAWWSAGALSELWQQLQSQKQSQARAAQLQSTSQRLAQEIAAFGVSPGAVRKALQVDSTEIEAAPEFRKHLVQLSQAMDKLGGARIQQLSWSLKTPQEGVCSNAETAQSVPAEAPPTTPERAVEVRVALARLGNTPWERERSLQATNQVLRAMEGVQVIEDPAERLRGASVSVGGQRNATDDTLAWCLRWPASSPRPGAPA